MRLLCRFTADGAYYYIVFTGKIVTLSEHEFIELRRELAAAGKDGIDYEIISKAPTLDRELHCIGQLHLEGESE